MSSTVPNASARALDMDAPLDRVPTTLSRYELARLVGVRSTFLQLGVDQEVHSCAGLNVLAVAASQVHAATLPASVRRNSLAHEEFVALTPEVVPRPASPPPGTPGRSTSI